METKCLDLADNKLIIDNKAIFDKFHEKHRYRYLEYNYPNEITIPVVINICLTNQICSTDLLKYCEYIINTLNDGFAGKIESKYKDPTYSMEYFSKILGSENHGKKIYDYINFKYDSGIRFSLKSIEYFNKDFEYDFLKNKSDTEELITNFCSNGFSIRTENRNCLNINLIKFSCETLGVSTFPWMKQILKKKYYPMLVFLDYKTVNPEISSNKFNKCRTLIHEVGHILGLKHIFGCKPDSILAYKIILGEKYYLEIFGKKELSNKKKSLIKLYPDIPMQKKPTLINPIEKNKFEIYNGVPVNFACFMDYSPDEVLTHFTKSQILIMRNIINMYKPKLVLNSREYKKESIKLYLPKGYIIDRSIDKLVIKEAEIKDKFYEYEIIYDNNKYLISDNYNILDKRRILDLESKENIENILSSIDKIKYIISIL
jgi:hypothetical protein